MPFIFPHDRICRFVVYTPVTGPIDRIDFLKNLSKIGAVEYVKADWCATFP